MGGEKRQRYQPSKILKADIELVPPAHLPPSRNMNIIWEKKKRRIQAFCQKVGSFSRVHHLHNFLSKGEMCTPSGLTKDRNERCSEESLPAGKLLMGTMKVTSQKQYLEACSCCKNDRECNLSPQLQQAGSLRVRMHYLGKAEKIPLPLGSTSHPDGVT